MPTERMCAYIYICICIMVYGDSWKDYGSPYSGFYRTPAASAPTATRTLNPAHCFL